MKVSREEMQQIISELRYNADPNQESGWVMNQAASILEEELKNYKLSEVQEVI